MWMAIMKNREKLKVFFEEHEQSKAGRARMTEGWNLRHRCEAGNVFVSTFMWFPLANHPCPTALKYALQYLSHYRAFV